MITPVLIRMAACLLSAAEPVKAEFYVATNGSDANPGALQAPFASLAKARDAVRTLIHEGLTKDVAVLIRGGVYTLVEPLVFGPEDSGTAEHVVAYAAYPGEKPVISGGRVITGWKRAEPGKWVVELPEVRSGKWRFRQLFADGVRLPRGRFPNAPSLLSVENVSPDVKQIRLSRAPGADSLTGKNAELVVYQDWSISRAAVVASQGKTVTSATPVGWIGHVNATITNPGDPAYVENAPEFVDQPGEWYLDQAGGTLTYMAGEHENPNSRRFIAPRLKQLVVVTGHPDSPVRSIHLQGLGFEHAAWSLPEINYLGIQAGHYGTNLKEPIYVLPLALEFTHAIGCCVERCRIAHTGACGIGFGAGCQHNQVKACELCDIGGNGIMIGWRGKGEMLGLAGGESLQADWPRPADAPAANQVANNVVHNCGALNHGCVGIYDAYSVGTRIAHNLVKDMPYTGISVGFRWWGSLSSQRACLVEYNHIHDCMLMLADGGGIYMLGFQPGTVLRGNLIHDIHRSPYAHGSANNGIFFDQGSEGYLVEGNIVYRTAGKPIRFTLRGKRFPKKVKQDYLWRDNSLGVLPGDPAFPEEAARRAGPLGCGGAAPTNCTTNARGKTSDSSSWMTMALPEWRISRGPCISR